MSEQIENGFVAPWEEEEDCDCEECREVAPDPFVQHPANR